MPAGPEAHSDELRYSQPGLEVVPDSSPTVVSPASPSSAHTTQTTSIEQLAPEVMPVKEETPGLELVSTLKRAKYRRRLFIWIGVLSLLLIAAIVGGVVGGLRSRTGKDNSAETPVALPAASKSPTATSPSEQTTASSPTATATLQSLRPDSRLAVTGWRADTGFKIRLFYQDRSNNLRFSDYSSDEGSWSSSTKASAGGIMAGTPMGAAAVMQDDPPQYELFWLNSSSMLSGQNFRDGVTPLGGLYDSIDEYPVAVNGKSRMAMYWPYAVMQDNGGLRLVTYLAGSQGGPWRNQSLGISGAEGISMAIIPRSSTYAQPYTAGLVYRGQNGRLAGYSLQWNQEGLDWDISKSWVILLPVSVNCYLFKQLIENRSSGTSNTIPEDAAIGAFAVAKENDSGNATIVYVVYQNANNDIELLIYDDAAWKSSPAMLKGADASTDITCLTEAIWDDVNVLSNQHDMSRCYFLSGGEIREVLYNGTGWEELGNIPLN
ncbi:hypothetical protein F5Y13DRAFT_206468 [Hypoxylon sp. FL1857]|nr:hypothetical protein F5Y13DRAFT_206468 [Hypoxylon sp. FL1857]